MSMHISLAGVWFLWERPWPRWLPASRTFLQKGFVAKAAPTPSGAPPRSGAPGSPSFSRKCGRCAATASPWR